MKCLTRSIAFSMLQLGALAYAATKASSHHKREEDACDWNWSDCCEETHSANADKNIVETAASTGVFSTLVSAVQAAGLAEVLKEGTFTVFAPTNEAFGKLEAETLQDLLKPENKNKLVEILTYHVVPGILTADDVKKIKLAGTVQGKALAVTRDGETIKIDNAKIVQTDIRCTNGVIHVIDTVLIPA